MLLRRKQKAIGLSWSFSLTISSRSETTFSLLFPTGLNVLRVSITNFGSLVAKAGFFCGVVFVLVVVAVLELVDEVVFTGFKLDEDGVVEPPVGVGV
jgi:hypothetical protein